MTTTIIDEPENLKRDHKKRFTILTHIGKSFGIIIYARKVLEKYHSLNIIIFLNINFIHDYCLVGSQNDTLYRKVNIKSNENPKQRYEIKYCKKEKWEKLTEYEREMQGKKERKEKISLWGYIRALFFIHSILLEIYQRDNSNNNLKDH